MIVLTYGTYDIIHYGHVGFLKRAKELAGENGKLIVGLSTDNFHEKLKHKPPCYFTYEQRKQVLEGIGYVDEIFPEETWEQKASDIENYDADILVMGDDWSGKFDNFNTSKCKIVTMSRTIEGQDPISDTLLKNDAYNRIAASHDKIDLIFPFVDNLDPEWQKQAEFWRNKETEDGILGNNNQTDARRYRVWNHLHYLFRGFERNIPWIDRIFLVLSSKTQIPKWLNTEHPKLRIVFHEDYMPKELLPSFNALSIESFYSFIPELGEYYIASNDDWFFLNPIPKDFFIKDGRLQLSYDPRTFYWYGGGKDSKDAWYGMLNKVMQMEMDMHNRFGRLHLNFSHLPEIRCKKLEQEWFSTGDNLKMAVDMFSKSKFRHVDNAVLNWFFIHLLKFNCDRIPFDIRTKKFAKYKCQYCMCEKGCDFGKYGDSGIVCFNDSSKTPMDENGFNKVRDGLLKFLGSKFPQKSEFETVEIADDIHLHSMRKPGANVDGLKNLINYVHEKLHKNLTVIEVGSFRGESTQIMLQTGKVDKIYCIDPWENAFGYVWNKRKYEYNYMSQVEEDFDRRFQNEPRVVKFKGTLDMFTQKNPDIVNVDVIYIDTDSKYDEMRRLIQVAKSIKPKFISGHDYTKYLNGGDIIRAVDNEFGKPDRTFKDNSFIVNLKFNRHQETFYMGEVDNERT